jgi:exopolyphosphatase/guanosine-5'-triphosphate,3'-diphosphate pyrophosphatase
MKVAVVDIGSNAIRSTFYGIDQIHGNEILMKKLSYLRLPIRLGEDVFVEGRISLSKVSNVLSMAQAFKHLCMIHEVKDHRLVATSAMREAKNGRELIELVRSQTQVEIELITGEEEAEMIFESIFMSELVDTSRSYMSIDVGGGSTEITFLNNGERKEARSFKLGSVRCKDVVNENVWQDFKNWITKNAKKYKPEAAIGSGGNINKMHRLCGYRSHQHLPIQDFREKVKELEGFTYQELVEDVKLKTDRAEGVARKMFRYHLEIGDV